MRIVVRSSPLERFVDPSGHMLLSSTSTDDTFDYVAVTMAGMTAAMVAATEAATAQAEAYKAYLASLDSSDVRKVSYSGPATVTVGASVRSSDVVAAGWASANQLSRGAPCVGGCNVAGGQSITNLQAESIGVSASLTAAGVGGLYLQLPEVLLIPYGTLLYGAQLNMIAGGIRGTWSYQLTAGQSATPTEAFDAFAKGEATGFLGWLLTQLP